MQGFWERLDASANVLERFNAFIARWGRMGSVWQAGQARQATQAG